VIEQIEGSRCPRCAVIVAPPARFCPHHPVEMVPEFLPGVGEIVTFTSLHSPPEGFRSPLHIAIVELDGGARFVCHGAATDGIKVGSKVAIEAVGRVYYFAHLGALDRARIFWRQTGRRGERVHAIARSWGKRAWQKMHRDAS
jgi:hypothetical protein